MSEFYDMPGHLIRRLQQISISVFAERTGAAGFDLTPVQFAALSAIAENEGVDQAGLAGLIAYDRVTMGGVIDRLEQKGLVDRKTSQTDRRARVLSLTTAGRKTLNAVLPVVRDLQDAILSGLNEAERRQFLVLLKKTTEAGNRLSRAPLRAGDNHS